MSISLMIGSTSTARRVPISLRFTLSGEGHTVTSDDFVATATNNYSRGGTITQALTTVRPRLIYFDEGPAFHFGGSAVRMQSDLPASAFKDLHDGTSDRTIAARFRVTDLSTNNTLFRTFNESASNVGIVLRITTTGDPQFRVGNGSANTNLLGGAGAIVENQTHTFIVRKEGTTLHMYIDDMDDGSHVATATITSPSSSDPLNSLIMGNTAGAVHGFVSDFMIVDTAANQSMRRRIAAMLERHSLQSLLAEIDVAEPPGEIAAGAVLRKVHASNTRRYTWEVATWIDDSDEIAIWNFTTRGSGGTVIGACRLRHVTRGNCWDSTRYFLAHNDGARSGTWTNAAGTGNFGGCLINDVSRTDGNSGESVTYTVTVPAGGKILWEYVGNAVSGRAHVVIRDSGATEIASGEYEIPDDSGDRYVDTLRSSGLDNEIQVALLATVVDADDYTVEITAAGGATWNRLYDRAVFALDTATSGDLSVDPWVPEQVVIGTGELSYAASDGSIFYGGAHGNEGDFTGLTAVVDSTDRAAELIAVGTTEADTRWAGDDVTIGYSTVLDGDWAGLTYSFRFDRYGCHNTMRREMLTDFDMNVEYVAMLQAPNLANGGFDRVAIDVEPREFFQIGTTTPVTTQSYNPSANNGAAFYTDTFASVVRCTVPALAATDANSSTPALLTDRNDGEIKDYRAIVSQDASVNTITVPAGQVREWTARYRVVPGTGFLTLIGT